VKKAAEVLQKRNKKVVICFLDLYNIRSEEQFYHQLAHAVINRTIRRIEELVTAVKSYLPKLMPKISLDTPSASSNWVCNGRTLFGRLMKF
jgi:hypothetical protein